MLEATAWSQGTINIGSNGMVVLHIAVDRGQLYGSDTVASLFNGATFTIRVEKAALAPGSSASTQRTPSRSRHSIPGRLDQAHSRSGVRRAFGTASLD